MNSSRATALRAAAWTALALCIAASLACSRPQRPASPPVATGREGDVSWNVWLRPDPLQQKGNAMIVEVLAGDGKPMPDAEAALEWDMPAMGSMPEMKGNADVHREAPGLFRLTFDFPMSGTWKLGLAIHTPRGNASPVYTATVGVPGLNEVARSASTDKAASSAAPSAMPLASPRAPIAASTSVPIVRMEPARRQAIGVTTAVVRRSSLQVPVRAVGTVVFDATKLSDVTVKYRGYIGRLLVDRPGQAVRKGEPLFTLYSPELFAAQQEYLVALASQREARRSGAPERADYLVSASRQRLRLWDLTSAQIERLAASGKPLEEVPIVAPASGAVVEKNVVAGSAVEPGATLFRLAGLDTVWVEADVYESDLPLLHVGDSAAVTLPYLAGKTFTGRIAFVYPYLDPSNRTGKVRIRLANRDGELKPDMEATVTLTRTLADRVVVPADAIVHTGDRSFVFVDMGDGRLVPRRLALGQTTTDAAEVVHGLQPGERIVTSGNFLVAAEARLQVPLEQWQ